MIKNDSGGDNSFLQISIPKHFNAKNHYSGYFYPRISFEAPKNDFFSHLFFSQLRK